MRRSWSVTPDIAETTTMGKASSGSCSLFAMTWATWRIRSPLPTEVPPNFSTLTLLSIGKLQSDGYCLTRRRYSANRTVSYPYDLYESHRLCIGGFAGLRGCRLQGLVQIIDQVINRFQANGKANVIGCDTCLILLFGR